jgi:RNA polymerase sigma-70 factor (ECF subfamily)
MTRQVETVVQFAPHVGADSPGGADDSALARMAFIDALYREYHLELVRYLRRICGSGPPEAEDLVQAAFVRIARIERVDKIQNPRAFLYKVAINLALTSLKHRARTRRFLEEMLRDIEIELKDSAQRSVGDVRERYDELNLGISLLTDKQRELIFRSRIKGETYSEISTDTGWSPADISRSLNKAVSILGCAVNRA